MLREQNKQVRIYSDKQTSVFSINVQYVSNYQTIITYSVVNEGIYIHNIYLYRNLCTKSTCKAHLVPDSCRASSKELKQYSTNLKDTIKNVWNDACFFSFSTFSQVIPSQQVFVFTPEYSMHSGESANANFTVFELIRSVFKPEIYIVQGTRRVCLPLHHRCSLKPLTPNDK